MRLQYGYDPAGNITSIADQVTPADSRTYLYDELERLTSADDGLGAQVENYAYDLEGNRTTSHLSVGYAPADEVNRIDSDDTYTYVHDDNGNLITKTENAAPFGVTDYVYDVQDQLVQVTRPDLSVITYAYDALGRRIEKNVAGAITRYVYDGPDILLEYDATGVETLIANYAHGPFTDQPLSKTERTGATPLGDYYYHANHQGSVIRITDAGGLTVNEYDYDAYGNALTAIEGIDNPYRYTAREWDEETGLLYYRARYYDPTTGRFLQQDPIGFAAGDLNLYRYVGSNPVNATDPSGLDASLYPKPPGMADPTDLVGPPEVFKTCRTCDEIILDIFVSFCIDFLFFGPSGEGFGIFAGLRAAREAERAADRAKEIHDMLRHQKTRDRTTTAVTETDEGVRVISSSENRLRPDQRKALKDGEIEGTGVGHAEKTGINAAKDYGLTPTGTAASRPICKQCQSFLKDEGGVPLSPLEK